MWTYNYTSKGNELYHHGVPGMKWGVRRTEAQLADVKKKQNTYVTKRPKTQSPVNPPESNDRTRRDLRDTGKATKGSEYQNRRPTKEQLGEASGIAKSAKSGFSDAANAAGVVERAARNRATSKTKQSLSTMTNRELQEKITRMQLEQQYASMTSSSKLERGASMVRTILEFAGSIAGVTNSALDIALKIKKLRGW